MLINNIKFVHVVQRIVFLILITLLSPSLDQITVLHYLVGPLFESIERV